MVCHSCNGAGYHVVPDEHDDPIQTPCLECASETWRIFHSAAYEKVSSLTFDLAAAQSRIRELEAENERLGSALDRANAPEKALLEALDAGEKWMEKARRWQREALAARVMIDDGMDDWREYDEPDNRAYAAARAANESEEE